MRIDIFKLGIAAVCGLSMVAFSVSGAHTADTESSALKDAASGAGCRYYQLVDSADCRLSLRQWAPAEEILKSALRLEPANPGNTLLFSNLGVAQMEQGKNKEALLSFSLALTRAPKSTTILTHRARLFLVENREDDALSDLNAILSIDSINEWALQTRGLLKLQSKTESDSVHPSDFSKLARVYPENPWGWFGMGTEAEERGDYTLAETNYRKSYELQHNAESSFRLGMLLVSQDRLEEAMTILRSALKENPTDGNLYAVMGWAHKKSYQTEEAEADLKLASQYGASAELLKWIKDSTKK